VEEITGTEYVVYNLTTDVQYTFTVKSKNAEGTSSGVSVTATPTASETASETVYAQDSFARADSSTTLGTDETGKTWTSYTAQTWGIQNNQAYPVVPDLNDPIFIDAGQSNYLAYEVRLAVANIEVQIMWRIATKDDYYVLDLYTNEISRVSADVWSSKGTIPAITNGQLLRVELRDGEHKIYVDGAVDLYGFNACNSDQIWICR
jgi:hypothetical protein